MSWAGSTWSIIRPSIAPLAKPSSNRWVNKRLVFITSLFNGGGMRQFLSGAVVVTILCVIAAVYMVNAHVTRQNQQIEALKKKNGDHVIEIDALNTEIKQLMGAIDKTNAAMAGVLRESEKRASENATQLAKAKKQAVVHYARSAELMALSNSASPENKCLAADQLINMEITK